MSPYLVLFYIFLISGGFAIDDDVSEEANTHRLHKRGFGSAFKKARKALKGKKIDIVATASSLADTSRGIHTEIRESKKEEPETKIITVPASNPEVRKAAERLGTVEKVADDFYLVGSSQEVVTCSPAFCKKLGRLGEAAFSGICSPEFCHCDTADRAWLKACGPGTVFNPVYRVCDWPQNVVGC